MQPGSPVGEWNSLEMLDVVATKASIRPFQSDHADEMTALLSARVISAGSKIESQRRAKQIRLGCDQKRDQIFHKLAVALEDFIFWTSDCVRGLRLGLQRSLHCTVGCWPRGCKDRNCGRFLLRLALRSTGLKDRNDCEANQ